MIVFGSHEYSPSRINYLGYKGINQIVLLNLSSPINEGIFLNYLLPLELPYPDSIDDYQVSFDTWYMGYIINNNEAFMDLMKIMYPIYDNPNVLVYILVQRNPYRDMITETLAKAIQVRYSYISNIINDIEDLDTLIHSVMNNPGLDNLDCDKERLSYLTTEV